MAVDRRTLAQQPDKKDKWPRTDRRQWRIESVLEQRQPALTVVLEDIHDPHNVAAVLRSCDSVGVLRAHLVYSGMEPPKKFARTTSGSANKWVEVVKHDSIEACYALLRAEGFAIHATALVERSVSVYDVDLTTPVALVFGNEMEGLSEAGISGADGAVLIPMRGMVQSLNISVACAVTLYEAQRQRAAAGMYADPRLDGETRQAMLEEWLHR